MAYAFLLVLAMIFLVLAVALGITATVLNYTIKAGAIHDRTVGALVVATIATSVLFIIFISIWSSIQQAKLQPYGGGGGSSFGGAFAGAALADMMF
jgi:hypothetical protein